MPAPRELPDKLTKLTVPSLQNALLLQWETLGVEPRRSAIELKIAHIKLETGLTYCHNWCIGNKRVGRGGLECWQFFGCGEEIPESQLAQVGALGPGLVDVKSRYLRGGVPYVSIKIRMPSGRNEARHPWTKFAAYETLIDGIEGQLAYLRRRPAVLSALMTGDPMAYCQALHAAAYFTADPKWYLKGRPDTNRDGLEGCVNDVVATCRDLDWGDVA